MPYIDRDAGENITGVYTVQQRDKQEFLAETNAEVIAYRSPVPTAPSAQDQKIAALEQAMKIVKPDFMPALENAQASMKKAN